jgi:hypothetical protein
LFPAPLRFTGIGLAFNIADIFEGLTPAAAIYFLHSTNSQNVYFWSVIVCCLISLLSYSTIKSEILNKR